MESEIEQRTEEDIFSEISELCLSEGYIYVLAWIALRDGLIPYEEQVSESSLEHLYSPDHLIRTEFSTLAGLAAKRSVSLNCPSSEEFGRLLEKTDALMKELHQAHIEPLNAGDIQSGLAEHMTRPNFYREAFYYSGEPAYYFQYRDLTSPKYCNDEAWFGENKFFSVDGLDSVLRAICSIHQSKVRGAAAIFTETGCDSSRLMALFSITIEELASQSGMDVDTVGRVINEFALRAPCNSNFDALNDFNEYNAKPLIAIGSDKFLLFQICSIAEAFYESPYYWMASDESYIDAAMENRGSFTECYSAERLKTVFGSERVFTNVNIVGPGKKIAGEIDVLVVFADRAIVLQAKSKKLTLESRKGNTQKIESDFAESVQRSYDQGFSCASFLNDGNYTLQGPDNESLFEGREFREILIFCVVLDSYPALSFQSRQFLKYQETEIIRPPFVMDVFFLDTLCELLTSPLRFLHFIDARIKNIDRVSSVHELTVLSYHLKKNLYIGGEADFVYIEDSVCGALDIAMMARRDDIPGEKVPDGILTCFQGTSFPRFIESIEFVENQAAVNLGFLLLTASEDAIRTFCNGIDTIIHQTLADGSNHDFGFGLANTGVTFHCNNLPVTDACEPLEAHCRLRAYATKSDHWFGVLISPNQDIEIRLVLQINEPWEHSDEKERFVAKTIGKKQGFSDELVLLSGSNTNSQAKRKRKLQRKARKKQRKKRK